MAAPKSVEELVKSVRSAGSWGFWVAAISALNAVMAATGSDRIFLFGSVIAAGAMQVAAPKGPIAQGLALGFNVLTIAFFAVMAIYARRGKAWAFVLIFVAYLLDTLVLLFDPQPLAIGFHLWVLFALWIGFTSARAWRKIREAPTAHPFPPELAAPPPLDSPPPTG